MKPDVVIIDYGNLVDDAGFRSRKEGLDNYIKGFRALAIHNDFCAIMGAQINRGTHEGHKIREPEIWELKETGELEQVADMIFLLHWQYFYDRDESIKNDYIINIAKNRDGRTAKKKIYFYPQWCKFVDREEEEKETQREDYTQKY
jgi:replicative DNA helicase